MVMTPHNCIDGKKMDLNVNANMHMNMLELNDQTQNMLNIKGH